MEAQILKIVEQSYIDRNDNEKSRLQTENLWLRDKIKDLEEMLKTEKKEKERLQRETKHQAGIKEPDSRREKEFEDSEKKRRTLEAEVQCLKQERERNVSEIKSQQEKCASLRKMLESAKKDLQYTSERLEMSQKEFVQLQERNTQLQEKEDKQEEEIKELKRQINIRDVIIQKENEDIRFTEVSSNNTRKTDLKASSSSLQIGENEQDNRGARTDDTGHNQQCKAAPEVITLEEEDENDLNLNKTAYSACKK